MIHRYIFKVLLFHISCPKEISRCLSLTKKNINTCCNTEATFALQPIKTHKFMSPSNHHLIAQEVPKPWNLFTFYKEHPNKNLSLSFPQKSAKRKQTGQRQWGASLSYQVTAFSCLTNGPPICPLKMKSCRLSKLQYLNTLNTFWTHCQRQTPEICQPHIGSTSQFTEFLFTSMHFFFPREKYVQCILSCMKTLDRSSTLG